MGFGIEHEYHLFNGDHLGPSLKACGLANDNTDHINKNLNLQNQKIWNYTRRTEMMEWMMSGGLAKGISW